MVFHSRFLTCIDGADFAIPSVLPRVSLTAFPGPLLRTIVFLASPFFPLWNFLVNFPLPAGMFPDYSETPKVRCGLAHAFE